MPNPRFVSETVFPVVEDLPLPLFAVGLVFPDKAKTAAPTVNTDDQRRSKSQKIRDRKKKRNAGRADPKVLQKSLSSFCKSAIASEELFKGAVSVEEKRNHISAYNSFVSKALIRYKLLCKVLGVQPVAISDFRDRILVRKEVIIVKKK